MTSEKPQGHNQLHIQDRKADRDSDNRTQQARYWSAAHKPKIFSRRNVLTGGLIAGSVLASGSLLAGCSLNPFQTMASVESTGNNQDRHLQFDTSWDGLDFAWQPDSRHLAYASNQGLFVVDVESGQKVWRQRVWPDYNYKYTQAISWSSDGTRLAYIANTAMLVQDVASGQNIFTHQDDYAQTSSVARAATLSPDGTLLAFSTDQLSTIIQVWNVQTRRLHLQYNMSANNKKPPGTSSITWSPDSTRIASTNLQGAVHVWNVTNGRQIWTYNNDEASGPREALGWSPDGTSIAFAAIGGQGQAQFGMWDAHTGQTRFQIPANIGYPISQDQSDKHITWSPDGAYVIIGAQDDSTPVTEVRSVQTGQRLFTCQRSNGQPTSITWSPDGKYLAAGITVVGTGELAGGDNGELSVVQFWNAHNGEALFTYSAPKSPDRVTWSPDSRYIALITPKIYGVLPDKTCLSLCQYGYEDYELEVFHVP